jgi:protein TonB
VAPEVPKAQPAEPVRVRTAAPHDFSEFDNGRITAPPSIPPRIKYIDGPEPAFASNIAADMSSRTPGGDGVNPFGARPPVTVVHTPAPSSVRLPSKLVEGFLIYKSIPQYPVIAKTVGQQGTVLLQAVISKSGTIENLQAISGPPMLQQAAIDAVKTWRYRPYLLNQQPVEVQTTVSVIFKIDR